MAQVKETVYIGSLQKGRKKKKPQLNESHKTFPGNIGETVKISKKGAQIRQAQNQTFWPPFNMVEN